MHDYSYKNMTLMLVRAINVIVRVITSMFIRLKMNMIDINNNVDAIIHV